MTQSHLFHALLFALVLIFSGCHQSSSSKNSSQSDTNFTIELDAQKLHAFTHTPVKVYTDDRSEEITPDVSIKSRDMGIAYYDKGEIHTQNPGDTIVTFSYLGREQNLSLHVKQNKPLYIQASSNKYSLHSKLSAPLSCNAFFDDNISQDITSNVIWSVTPKDNAYIDTNTSRLHALKEGNITIRASYQGLSSSFDAIVLNANIDALSLSDTSVSLHNKTTYPLQATLHYDDGLKEDATRDVIWNSITPQTVSVSQEGILQAHQRGSSYIEATFGDFTQSIPVEVLHNTINSMLISNQHDALYIFHYDEYTISQSGCFELLGKYDDGLTQNISQDALWNSSNPDILSFTNNNCFQTKSHGDVTVTASKDGITTTFNARVTSKELVDLELHTPVSILDKGMRATLNSYGIDGHGDQYNLDQQTFWYSNNQAIASVLNDTHAGELFARNTGDVRIQTRLASLQRSIDLKIDTAALVSIEIIPDINASIPQGYEKNLKVYGDYADGTKQEITSLITWKTSYPHIAKVDENGVLKALSSGETTITASLGSVYDTLALKVTDPEVVAIIVEAPQIQIKRSKTMHMKAFGIYSNGVKRDFTDVVIWSSYPSYIATVTNGGYFYAANIGYVNVTASYKKLSDSVQVSVIEPDILSINVILQTDKVDINQSTQAQAIAIYSDKRRDDITTKATWTSLDPAIASIDKLGKITGVKVGDATIRAFYKGFFDEDSIEVYTSAQALVIDAPSDQMDINTSMQLTAFEYFSDGSRSDVTDMAQWSSTDPLKATVTQNGNVTALTTGLVKITAEYDSFNTEHNITITSP